MKKLFIILLVISYTFILSAQNERIDMEIDANKRMTIKADSVMIHGNEAPLLLAEIDSSVVRINNRLHIENADSAGIGIYNKMTGQNSTGIYLKTNFPSLDFAGTLTGIRADVFAPTFGASGSNAYGGYFDARCRSSTGIYVSSRGGDTGTAWAGIFETTHPGNGTVGGIKVNVSGGNIYYEKRAGEFTVSGNLGTAVYGLASGTSTSSYDYTNVGGRFISEGNEGKGVVGHATDDRDIATNIGGEFLAAGANGTGIYAVATNSGVNSNNIGGQFIASGETAWGIKAQATNMNSTSETIGGEFISRANKGIGVRGMTSNSSSEITSYGGYFESSSKKGVGVYGVVTNTNPLNFLYGGIFEAYVNKGIGIKAGAGTVNATSETIGGDFFARGALPRGVKALTFGSEGVGVYAQGEKYGVWSRGNLYVQNLDSDAVISMRSATGLENRVIVLQDNDADIFFGDIDGQNRDVRIRANGINRVNIKNSGRVGISENAPSHSFHVDNPDNAIGAIRLQNQGATKLTVAPNGGVTVGYNSSTPSRALSLSNDATTLVGIARAFAWQTYSDARVKSNEKKIQYGLDEIMSLRPLSYNHHSSVYEEERGMVALKGKESVPTIGFFAQEVHKVIPEAAQKPEDESTDLWSMDYEKLIPVLVKGMQEQQEIIESLMKQNKELLVRMEQLEAKSETSNTNFPK